MSAFFEFCKTHPWQIMIVLFSVASFSMTLGYIISSLFANGKLDERVTKIIRNLHNPVNISRRIEKQ